MELSLKIMMLVVEYTKYIQSGCLQLWKT